MEARVLLAGGERRQTHLAALVRRLGRVCTLAVPDCPDTAEPGPVDLLILPCPCTDRTGRIRGTEAGLDPEDLRAFWNRDTRVFGGAYGPLRRILEEGCERVVDLLEDPRVAAENARLTAEAALLLVRTRTEASLQNHSCAVLGWGRIAKCLAPMLRAAGARVLVCARGIEALAEAESLGFRTCPLRDYRVREDLVFNTVPARVLTPDRLTGGRSLWVELASAPGGLPEQPPLPVLDGASLPGRILPRSAAEILYQGILRNLR